MRWRKAPVGAESRQRPTEHWVQPSASPSAQIHCDLFLPCLDQAFCFYSFLCLNYLSIPTQTFMCPEPLLFLYFQRVSSFTPQPYVYQCSHAIRFIFCGVLLVFFPFIFSSKLPKTKGKSCPEPARKPVPWETLKGKPKSLRSGNAGCGSPLGTTAFGTGKDHVLGTSLFYLLFILAFLLLFIYCCK